MLLGIAVGCGVVAALAARFVGVDGPPGWPLGADSREEFWRRSLPWPRGVQEDDEIAWHVPPVASAETEPAAQRPGAGLPVPPTRPQRRVVGR
jgi:hypothetical protein